MLKLRGLLLISSMERDRATGRLNGLPFGFPAQDRKIEGWNRVIRRMDNPLQAPATPFYGWGRKSPTQVRGREGRPSVGEKEGVRVPTVMSGAFYIPSHRIIRRGGRIIRRAEDSPEDMKFFRWSRIIRRTTPDYPMNRQERVEDRMR